MNNPNAEMIDLGFRKMRNALQVLQTALEIGDSELALVAAFDIEAGGSFFVTVAEVVCPVDTDDVRKRYSDPAATLGRRLDEAFEAIDPGFIEASERVTRAAEVRLLLDVLRPLINPL